MLVFKQPVLLAYLHQTQLSICSHQIQVVSQSVLLLTTQTRPTFVNLASPHVPNVWILSTVVVVFKGDGFTRPPVFLPALTHTTTHPMETVNHVCLHAITVYRLQIALPVELHFITTTIVV